jgi:TP901 family phage tail tape measure protein
MGELILRLLTDVQQYAAGLNEAREHFRVFSATVTAMSRDQANVIRENIERLQEQARATQARIATIMNTPIDKTAMDAARVVVRQLEDDLRRAREAVVAIQRAPGGPGSSDLSAAQQQVQNLSLTLARARGEYQLLADAASLAARQQSQELAGLKADLLQINNQLQVERANLAGYAEAAKTLMQDQRSLLNLVAAQVTAHAQSLVLAGSTLRQIGGVFKSLSLPLFAFTAALVLLGSQVAKLGAEYSQTIDIVRSTLVDMSPATQEAEQRFQRLEKVIVSLGEKLKFTTAEVATAAKYLAQAGLTSEQVMAALPGTLNLALSGMLDLGRAAEIAADFMNAFNLSGEQINRVADVIAKAAVVANTSVEQLGNAFSFVTPVAATMGQSIEDVAVGLAALSNSAIKSSRAGTGLAQILSGLVKDADKTDAMMRKYGSSFERVNPEVRSLIEILREFQAVGVSTGDVMHHFGERAGRAMLALMNTPPERLMEYASLIHDSFGAALEQAQMRWQNLSGAIAEFQSKLEALGIAVFRIVEQDLVRALKLVVDQLGVFLTYLRNPANETFVKGVIYATGALGVLTAVLGTAFLAVGMFAGGIGGLATFIGSMSLAINATNGSIGRATVSMEHATVIAGYLAAGNYAAADSYRDLAARAAVAGTAVDAAALQAEMAARGHGVPTAPLSALQQGMNLISLAVRGILAYLPQIAAVLAVMATLSIASAEAYQRSNEQLKEGEGLLQKISLLWNGLVAIVGGLWKATGDWIAETFLGVGQWDILVTQIQLIGENLAQIAHDLMPLINLFSVGLVVTVVVLARVLSEIALLILNLMVGGLKLGLAIVTAWVSVITGLPRKLYELVDATLELVGVSSEVRKRLLGWAETLLNALDTAKMLKKVVGETKPDAVASPGSQFLVDQKPESRFFASQVKELQEYVKLLGESDKNSQALGAAERIRLSELKEKYGDLREPVESISKFVADSLKKLEALKADPSQSAETKELAEVTIGVYKQMEEQLKAAQKAYRELDAVGSEATQRSAKQERELAKALEERASADTKATNAREALAKGEKQYLEFLERLQKAELTGWRKELFEQTAMEEELAERMEKNKKLREDVIKANDNAIKSNEAALIASEKAYQERRAKLVEEYTKARPDLSEEELNARLSQDAGLREVEKDLENRKEGVAKAKEILEKEKAHNDEVNKSEAETQKAVQGRRIRVEQEIANKKIKLLEDVKLAEARATNDKMTIAKAEAQRFLEEEQKKVDAIYDMSNAADKKLADEVMERARNVAQMKIAEVQKELDEKAAKEAEKAEKDAKKKLKDAIDPVKTMELQAAEAVAKHVRSVRELIQLYIALYQIRMHQEVSARKAFERTIQEQEKAARMQRGVDLNPNNPALLQALAAQQRRAAFAAMVTGKRIAAAGMSPEQISLFEGLIVGAQKTTQVTADVAGILQRTQNITNSILGVLTELSKRLGVPNLPAAPAGAGGAAPAQAPANQPQVVPVGQAQQAAAQAVPTQQQAPASPPVAQAPVQQQGTTASKSRPSTTTTAQKMRAVQRRAAADAANTLLIAAQKKAAQLRAEATTAAAKVASMEIMAAAQRKASGKKRKTDPAALTAQKLLAQRKQKAAAEAQQFVEAAQKKAAQLKAEALRAEYQAEQAKKADASKKQEASQRAAAAILAAIDRRKKAEAEKEAGVPEKPKQILKTPKQLQEEAAKRREAYEKAKQLERETPEAVKKAQEEKARKEQERETEGLWRKIRSRDIEWESEDAKVAVQDKTQRDFDKVYNEAIGPDGSVEKFFEAFNNAQEGRLSRLESEPSTKAAWDAHSAKQAARDEREAAEGAVLSNQQKAIRTIYEDNQFWAERDKDNEGKKAKLRDTEQTNPRRSQEEIDADFAKFAEHDKTVLEDIKALHYSSAALKESLRQAAVASHRYAAAGDAMFERHEAQTDLLGQAVTESINKLNPLSVLNPVKAVFSEGVDPLARDKTLNATGPDLAKILEGHNGIPSQGVSQEELDRLNPYTLTGEKRSAYSKELEALKLQEERESFDRTVRDIQSRQDRFRETQGAAGLLGVSPQAMGDSLLAALRPLQALTAGALVGALAPAQPISPLSSSQTPQTQQGGNSTTSIVKNIQIEINSKLDMLTFKQMFHDVMSDELQR